MNTKGHESDRPSSPSSASASSPIPLDYKSPVRRQRISFLEKCNPKATRASVIRSAILTSLMGAGLWFLGALTAPGYWKTWPIALPGLMLSGAFCGAVFEWQVGRADDSRQNEVDPRGDESPDQSGGFPPTRRR